MQLIRAGGLSCLRLPARYSPYRWKWKGMEPHTIFLTVQGDVDFLAVCLDEKSHEVTSKGVSSVPGRNRAEGFQETGAYPSQWNNYGMATSW